MKTILNTILILLVFAFANCSSKKGNSSSVAALALVSGSSTKKSSASTGNGSTGGAGEVTAPTTCKVNTGRENKDRKLYTASTTKQDLFTTQVGTSKNEVEVVKIEAKANTVLTVKNFAKGMIGVYKNFTTCPYDATASASKTTSGTEYTQGGAGTTTRTYTFSKDGTYLLTFFTGFVEKLTAGALPSIQITTNP